MVAFLNTLDLETGHDDLAPPEAMLRWGHEAGISGAAEHRTPTAETEHARVLELRGAVRALLAAREHRDQQPDATAWLTSVLNSTPLRARASQGALALEPVDPQPASQITAAIVNDCLAAQASGAWRRVRVCRNPACQWAFLDSSRNARRIWCEMATCGTAAKMRSYRDRRRRQEPPPASNQTA